MMYVFVFIAATTLSGAGVLSTERLALQASAARSMIVSFFEWFGSLGAFCARLAHSALLPPYEFRELLRQCDWVGSKSLPLVALAGAATGVVLSLETR